MLWLMHCLNVCVCVCWSSSSSFLVCGYICVCSGLCAFSLFCRHLIEWFDIAMHPSPFVSCSRLSVAFNCIHFVAWAQKCLLDVIYNLHTGEKNRGDNVLIRAQEKNMLHLRSMFVTSNTRRVFFSKWIVKILIWALSVASIPLEWQENMPSFLSDCHKSCQLIQKKLNVHPLTDEQLHKLSLRLFFSVVLRKTLCSQP